MSKLIKSIKKGIKKIFRAVKKVVKKIVKSKIFKAVVIAAAIYFTAGAIAGTLSSGAASGAAATTQAASAGAAATSSAAVTGATATAAQAAQGAAWFNSLAPAAAGTVTAGSTATGIGSTISGLLSAGASKVGSALAWTTQTPANAMITATGMNIAGQVIGAKAQSDAEWDRYKADKAEYDANTSFQLNVADRLAAAGYPANDYGPALTKYQPTTTQGKTGGQAQLQQPYANTGYYDPTTDTYRNV